MNIAELKTAHFSSQHGISVLLIDGQAYGPRDNIEHTPYAHDEGIAATAAYLAAAEADGSDNLELIAKARLFCSQWPEGPQPVPAE